MSEKKRKIFWYFIGIGVCIVFLLFLVSSTINIGERLRNIHPHVEYTFYVLIALLVWFLILNPLRIIAFSPSLSIVTTLDKDSIKAHKTYKTVSKNIIENNVLTDEEKNALLNYKSWDELRDALHLSLNGSVKKQIQKIIVRNARSVLISTAISQNQMVDTYSTISINLRLIKEIVSACGFRPSFKNLSKLSLRVASTALIADGLESINIEDVLPTQTLNSLSNVPFLKPFLASVSQGVINALLTIRVGVVTRNYLFNESTVLDKKEIRANAFKDAVVILPLVIADAITIFPRKVINLFTKKDENVTKEKNSKKEESEA